MNLEGSIVSTKKQLELQIKTPVIPPELPQYPNALAISPIFVPTQTRSKFDTKDWASEEENSFPIPGGRLQRFGPGLNLYDEDTLIALFQLARQYRHEGAPERFPIPISSSLPAIVFSGVLSSWDVNRFLGRPDNGRSLSDTWKSILRLSRTTLSILTDTFAHTDVEFFKHRAEDIKNPRGRILVQFSPEISNILKSYISFDMSIRMALPDTGKALYRFLLLQEKKTNKWLVTDLARECGYAGKPSDFKNLLVGKKGRESILEILKEKGIIENYEFSGRGKTAAFIIVLSSGI